MNLRDKEFDVAANAAFEMAKLELEHLKVSPTYRMQVVAERSEHLSRVVASFVADLRGIFKPDAEDDVEHARRIGC